MSEVRIGGGSSECVFCRIIAKDAPGNIVAANRTVIVLEPLGPHAPGHVIVIPRLHVPDATTDAELAGDVFAEAARYLRDVVRGDGNILTSVGEAATQTVRHLHVHVIPRNAWDELPIDWPWMRGVSA